MLAYYIPVWRARGRDPEEGVIVTRYEPPKGFSPASLRYIQQMYYDDKVMTAAVVNLAVKGYLEIQERGDSHWLKKKKPEAAMMDLAAGEKELYDGLFKDGESVELDDENHKVLGKARAAHRKSLKTDYNKQYFQTNIIMNIPAIIIVLISSLIALNIGRGPGREVCRQLSRKAATQLCRKVRMGLGIGGHLVLPGLLPGRPGCFCIPAGINGFRNLESFVFPAQGNSGCRDFLRAQCSTVSGLSALLVG